MYLLLLPNVILAGELNKNISDSKYTHVIDKNHKTLRFSDLLIKESSVLSVVTQEYPDQEIPLPLEIKDATYNCLQTYIKTKKLPEYFTNMSITSVYPHDYIQELADLTCLVHYLGIDALVKSCAIIWANYIHHYYSIHISNNKNFDERIGECNTFIESIYAQGISEEFLNNYVMPLLTLQINLNPGQFKKFMDTQYPPVPLELQGHTTHLTCIKYSPQGNFIVSAEMNGDIIIWHKCQQRLIENEKHMGHFEIAQQWLPLKLNLSSEPVTAVIWNQDESNFISISNTHTLLWYKDLHQNMWISYILAHKSLDLSGLYWCVDGRCWYYMQDNTLYQASYSAERKTWKQELVKQLSEKLVENSIWSSNNKLAYTRRRNEYSYTFTVCILQIDSANNMITEYSLPDIYSPHSRPLVQWNWDGTLLACTADQRELIYKYDIEEYRWKLISDNKFINDIKHIEWAAQENILSSTYLETLVRLTQLQNEHNKSEYIGRLNGSTIYSRSLNPSGTALLVESRCHNDFYYNLFSKQFSDNTWNKNFLFKSSASMSSIKNYGHETAYSWNKHGTVLGMAFDNTHLKILHKYEFDTWNILEFHVPHLIDNQSIEWHWDTYNFAASGKDNVIIIGHLQSLELLNHPEHMHILTLLHALCYQSDNINTTDVND